MKLSISKVELLDALQTSLGVVSTRATLPILSNVLLNAEASRLTLTTTDLDVSFRCSVEADVGESGATTLPARRLMTIVRELPADRIELAVDKNNTATLNCGASRFRIHGMSDEDFPPLPKLDGGNTYSMDQAVLRDMLVKIAYSAAVDETRYILNGVLMKFTDGKATFVATDGRRLALIESELEFPEEAGGASVVPSKAVNELLHALGEEGNAKIHVVDNQIAFEFSDCLVVSKLIEGTYPNYQQVVPAESTKRVPLDREALLTALKRVSLVTSEKSNSVKLTFTRDQLEISVVTPDVGEAREIMAVKYPEEELTIAFNPEFMMAPLRNLVEDQVYLELTDELSPGVIKCDKPFLYVLMPMRVT